MRIKMLTVAIVLAVVATACADDASEPADTTVTTAEATTTTTTTVPATTTTVAATTTTEAEAEIETSPVVAGEDEDVDAIVLAYTVVFDSTTSYEEKAPYVVDFEGLESTVTAYAEAGAAMGGISLSADEVGIDGDNARVIYSFLFAGNPAYSDLEGSAVRTDAGWQISREFFCNIMTSARVGCP